MNNIQITFLGSGDAFGSGGRFNACILVKSPSAVFLLDCGASSPVAIRRFGVDPNEIDLILLSHLHGDHFGGVPFFILDAQLISKRSRPLTVAGPQGTGKRLADLMEAMFPGSSKAERKFALEIIDLNPEITRTIGEVTVTPYPVEHPSGNPPLALRIQCAGKNIAYTGDTGWTDTLIPAAREADLLISECYYYDKKVPYHLDFQTLTEHLDQIRPKRVIVTHMSHDMLSRLDDLPLEHASDGKVIEL